MDRRRFLSAFVAMRVRLGLFSLALLIVMLAPAILFGQLDGSQLPGAAGADPVIDAARQKTISFDETLPNYIVKQFTTRYTTDPKTRDRAAWKQLDVVTADVVYDHGRESYANVLDNGKRTKKTLSRPEPGRRVNLRECQLKTLLSPASEAQFSNKQQATVSQSPGLPV